VNISIISGLVIVLIIQGVVNYLNNRRQQEMYEHNNMALLNYLGEQSEEWKVERQQLLDRIQAPSYDHLKHHEVKVIKAQNNEKEPPKLEVL
jgi:hypothetical protein